MVGVMRAISGNPRMAPYVYISTAQERYSGNLNLNRMPQTELRLCLGENPTESDALMDPWNQIHRYPLIVSTTCYDPVL